MAYQSKCLCSNYPTYSSTAPNHHVSSVIFVLSDCTLYNSLITRFYIYIYIQRDKLAAATIITRPRHPSSAGGVYIAVCLFGRPVCIRLLLLLAASLLLFNQDRKLSSNSSCCSGGPSSSSSSSAVLAGSVAVKQLKSPK